MSIDNLAGRVIGQYHLEELLGVGAMGAVYRAHQPALERDVAVKLLPSALAAQPDYVARFTREAKIAASLEHPHIVPLHDYGTQNGVSYVVMRMLTGGTLAQRLNQRALEEGRVPALAETASMLRQVASALDYAHRKGVVHRDIKPNNIMFDDEGGAYIVDFGIAKLLNVTTSITGGQTVFGTPHYMPPEQWRDEELTPETDQYALAVVIYSMITGEPPFDAPTPHALMYKHFHEEPPALDSKRPGLPAALSSVMQRALAKIPSERFLTVTAFSQAFDAAVADVDEPSTGFFTFPLSKDMMQVEAPLPLIPQADGRQAAPAKAYARPALDTESEPETLTISPVPVAIPPAPPLPPMAAYQPTPASTGVQPASKRRSGLPPVAVGMGLGLALLAALVCAGIAYATSQANSGDRQPIDGGGIPGQSETTAEGAVTQVAQAEVIPTLTTLPSVTPVSLPSATPDNVPTSLPMPGATITVLSVPTSITTSANTTTALTLVPVATTIRVASSGGGSGALNVAQRVSLLHGVEPVRGVAFSPGGGTLATGAADGTIHLWSTDGTERGRYSGGGGVIYGIAFSPDGRFLAAAHEDGIVRVWETSSGTQVGTLTGHTAATRDVAFSPDGRLIASASEDNTARIWDASTYALLTVIKRQDQRILSVAFSPDSRLLATACTDGAARLWDAATGNELATFTGTEGEVRSVAFSPAGDRLATAGTDGYVRVWDIASEQQVHTLAGHSGSVWTVKFSPDGALIASGGRDNTARLWDAASGDETAVLRGHGGWVLSLAFSGDSTELLTGSGDGSARVWDIGAG